MKKITADPKLIFFLAGKGENWNPKKEEANKANATHALVNGRWYGVKDCKVEANTNRIFLEGSQNYHSDTKVRHYAGALCYAPEHQPSQIPTDMHLAEERWG